MKERILRLLVLLTSSSCSWLMLLQPPALFTVSRRGSSSFCAVALVADPPIRNVVVVGGTHGNEYTGVWVVNSLQRGGEQRQKKFQQQYPSLDISFLIGNPDAVRENRRFIDTDLNRAFPYEQLSAASSAAEQEQSSPSSTTSSTTRTLEGRRASDLNEQLGPKAQPRTDLIVDMHSTTSNMGLTLIVREGDVFMATAAAYIVKSWNEQQQARMQHQEAEGNGDDDNATRRPSCQILMHATHERMGRPNLSSLAHHGFTIEVGPVPQGVLRHDAVEMTEFALSKMLDIVEQLNQGDISVYKDIQRYFPDQQVPCFRSAAAVRPGELSGKISWPSSPDNPNFPNWMIHKDRQDRDFELIKTGDPLFVSLSGEVITYNGSHGDSVHLMFVNEGGYYYKSSGTGIGVAVRTSFDLETAQFVGECLSMTEDGLCTYE